MDIPWQWCPLLRQKLKLASAKAHAANLVLWHQQVWHKKLCVLPAAYSNMDDAFQNGAHFLQINMLRGTFQVLFVSKAMHPTCCLMFISN